MPVAQSNSVYCDMQSNYLGMVHYGIMKVHYGIMGALRGHDLEPRSDNMVMGLEL